MFPESLKMWFLISLTTILVLACAVSDAQLSRIRCIGALEYTGADLPVALNATVICSLPRGNVSDYATVSSGFYEVRLNAGLTTSVSLAAGVSYNLAFRGPQADIRASLSVVNETIDATQVFVSRLRVIALQPTGSAPTTVNIDGSPMFANLSETAPTDYVELDPGTHTVTIGSSFQLSIQLTASSSYSLVVWGGTDTAAIFVVDTTFIVCTVRPLHLAYGNRNNLAISVDNGLVVNTLWPNVAYASGYYNFVYFQSNVNSSFRIQQRGSADTLLQFYSPNLVRYESMTLIIESVAATPAQLTASIVIDDNSSPGDGSLARFQFIVATDTFPPLDLRVDDLLLASGVSFGMSSPSTTASLYTDQTLRVFRTGEETNPVATLTHSANSGSIYTLALSGPPDAPVITVVNGSTYRYASMRFAHAAPDVGKVDVYVDNALFWSSIEYKNNDSVLSHVTWMSAAASTYNVQVFAAGTNTTALFQHTLGLPSDSTFTLVLAGLASAGNASARGLTMFVSKEFFGIIDGTTMIRLVHASPGTPPLTMLLDGKEMAAGVGYNSTSVYSYMFGAGSFDIKVQISGTQTVVFEASQYRMPGTSVHTVIIEGVYGDAIYPLVGVTSVDFVMPDLAEVRFLNALSDSVVLDSFVDGLLYVHTIGAHATTGYTVVYPDFIQGRVAGWTHNVSLAPTGALAPKVAKLSATFAEGAQFTLIAAANSTAPQSLFLRDNNTIPFANQTRIRFINLASNAGAVSIVTPNQTWFSEVEFLNPTEYITVPSGSYQIKVTGGAFTRFAGVYEFASNSVYTLTFEAVPPSTELRSTLDATGLPPPPPPPPPADNNDDDKKKRELLAIEVAVPVGVFVLLGVAVVAFFGYRRRQRAKYTQIDSPRLAFRP
eukprot:TRINITY_DN3055_c0_g1_i1.p1 TRINITY_DN3055_c0_g1~~TRINITY_DN3055_c0_g1_i1.p1  ORF type:complete len:888 (-),score=262.35 TRINITY_DN3055_c0_g1_i1:102-2765(-)